jgi:hypothetical protein
MRVTGDRVTLEVLQREVLLPESELLHYAFRTVELM